MINIYSFMTIINFNLGERSHSIIGGSVTNYFHLISEKSEETELLTREEEENPLLVFRNLFFEQTELPGWRRDIKELLAGIHASEPYWKGNSPLNLLDLDKSLRRLLEAGYLVYKRELSIGNVGKLQKENLIPLTAVKKEESLEWEIGFYPKYLSNEEMLSPIKALQAVFKDGDLKELKRTLTSWVEISLAPHDLFGLQDGREVQAYHILLNKLLEACHLIYVREYPQKNQTEL